MARNILNFLWRGFQSMLRRFLGVTLFKKYDNLIHFSNRMRFQNSECGINNLYHKNMPKIGSAHHITIYQHCSSNVSTLLHFNSIS